MLIGKTEMNSYSEYIQITSDKLIINFPAGFYKGKALLEITPIPDTITQIEKETNRREHFKKLLLQRPGNLNKDEIVHFQKISKWFKEWIVKEY